MNLTHFKKFCSIDEIELLQKVIECGEIIMPYWPVNSAKPTKPLNVQIKADGSKVTDADFASNVELKSFLERKFPSDLVCSEEAPIELSGREQQKIWFVDPLDGTSHFINGQNDFSILVGLCDQGDPVFGLIYFPARKILAVAKKGCGAILQDGQSLKMSKQHEIINSRLYIRYFTLPGSGYLSNLDSGDAQIQVANGQLDAAVIRLKSHKTWDIAAVAAIILESGGKISDENGQKIKFNRETVGEKYYVATNRLIHAQMLEKLKLSQEV